MKVLATIAVLLSIHGPYSRPTRGEHHAIAASRSGALLAWSENAPAPRIHIALLDFHGRIVSPIAILPAVSDRSDAIAPAVASNGHSFAVHWIERERGNEHVRGVLVDAHGVPIATPRTLSTGPILTNDVIAPRIFWNGEAYEAPAVAMAATNGVRGTASAKLTQLKKPGYGCLVVPCIYNHYADAWDVVWTAGVRTGEHRIGITWPIGAKPISPPDIAAASTDFAVAWSSSLGMGYLVTNDGLVRTVYAKPKIDVPPALGCNDEQGLVAYGTTSGDVHAFLFDTDGLTTPTLLTIAATERLEHAPQVVRLGASRFLVTYHSDLGAEDHCFGGRVVTFEPPARRRLMR